MKIRDSCIGSAIQIWHRVQLHWLAIGYGLMMVLFFFLIVDRLSKLPLREQMIHAEMERLKLEQPVSKKR